MPGAYVGRQAIYDRSLSVHAYELLYREASGEMSAVFDGDRATAQVVSDAFLQIGAQRLVGDVPCFLNLTHGYVTGQLPLPLPPDRVVVEVLEDVQPTPEVLEGIRRFKRDGVRIALDDYAWREGDEALLELADYVKVDLRAQDREDTRALCDRLRTYGVKLLAEKVESREELEFCRDLGFDYFQGFFLEEPELVSGHRVPSNRIGLLRILARLHDDDLDVGELGELIGQDVALAYKMLRYSNSTLYAPAQEITTLQQCLVLLGLQAIREIVSLIILLDLDDRPGDLVQQALVRGRMCQRLAERAEREEASSYFTVGLLSTLDALTGVPMDELLDQLPLSESLSAALLREFGDLGAALHCARAYERGEWEEVAFDELSSDDVRESFLEAIESAERVRKNLPDGASS